MKKVDVMNFLLSIKDCEEIERIYIENGINRDYIEVKYYNKNRVFKKKDGIYKKEK